jgi:hypothetical protein
MCTTPEFQAGKDCFWVRQRQVLFTETFPLCRERLGGNLATLFSNDHEKLAINISSRFNQDLWIVERTLRKKRQLEVTIEEGLNGTSTV